MSLRVASSGIDRQLQDRVSGTLARHAMKEAVVCLAASWECVIAEVLELP